MLLSRYETGWVRTTRAYWRAGAVQQKPGCNKRWNVHICCALWTPPYYGGFDRACLLHAGGQPYSAPLVDCIHRAERWCWRVASGRTLGYGPDNPQSQFELDNAIPDVDELPRPSAPARFPNVGGYPDPPDLCEFHTTRPVLANGQVQQASVVRDPATRAWGIWLSGDAPGWMRAGGEPYRAPVDVCTHRAERWYWQKVCGSPLPHGERFPQPSWEMDNAIPDLDDDLAARGLTPAVSA